MGAWMVNNRQLLNLAAQVRRPGCGSAAQLECLLAVVQMEGVQT